MFQDTVLRVEPLADGAGRLVVVAGVNHRSLVLEQLDQLGVDAQVLLEPEARDSAAAMAVAAAWAQSQDDDAVVAFVASDHHISEHPAFRDAIRAAAAKAEDSGRIVILGIVPTSPSPAYGYIRPAGSGLSDVERFVEKPDPASALEFVQAGYLWNSGNFVVQAKTMLSELSEHHPTIELAARAALLGRVDRDVIALGDGFLEAPKISIDYALMEKTKLASVLEVDFDWSDLGAWDAVAATGVGDAGLHIREDADGCLVRSPDGMLVAAVGVRNLAIIAEKDAVLVCDLSRAQDMRAVVERIRRVSPGHLDFPRRAPEALSSGACRFADWLRLRALPLWATIGQAANGMFAEAIADDGRPVAAPRRARVQARQIYVFGRAGLLGWAGPWRRCVDQGVQRLIIDYLRDDGLCRTLLDADGSPLDDRALVFDQAFAILAFATAQAVGCEDGTLEARARTIREGLRSTTAPNGAFVEDSDAPFQSNCHMHLLEACLAWEEISGDVGWSALADQIVALARSTFIDAEEGFLRERFGADWCPAPGEAGRLIEPGHQFEWAWLLAQYSRMRSDAGALEVARRLYRHGMHGVVQTIELAVDQVYQDGSMPNRRARLWPQTEWLKASLLLSELNHDDDQMDYLADAATAQRAIWRYLLEDGRWRDKALPEGGFVAEPAPASSLYHIMAAFQQLSSYAASGRFGELSRLDLR